MLRAILVDDNKMILQGLTQLVAWNKLGIQIARSFNNGVEALEYMKEEQDIDILFTDIKMPLMDGISLIRKVNSLDKNIEIVCLSGYGEYELVREAFLLGARDYILKAELDVEHIEKICVDIYDELIASKQARDNQQILINNQLVQEVVNEIDRYYFNSLTLKKLSERYGITNGYLGKLFYQEVGMSFNEYLNRKRVEKAVEMIETGQYKIYEIAYACGYNNIEHFSRMFKKITGKNPKRWKSNVV